MRFSLFILGVFVAGSVPKDPQKRKTSTMFGRRERGWQELWGQSDVPARTGTISID